MNSEDTLTQLFPDQDSKRAPMDQTTAPLAYRLRATSFDDYVGQQHLVGPDKPLRRLIDEDQLISLVLWGPPGCGKTTLSKLVSHLTASQYISINAAVAKISEIKDAVTRAKAVSDQQRTILFIDEIHRFNKLQIGRAHV